MLRGSARVKMSTDERQSIRANGKPAFGALPVAEYKRPRAANVLADVRENIDEARHISAWIAIGAEDASLAHVRQRVDTRSNS